MKLKEWLKETGFSSVEEALENGDIHIEDTERDMKLWFLQDLSTEEILEILDEAETNNYKTWNYIEDIDKWIFVY